MDKQTHKEVSKKITSKIEKSINEAIDTIREDGNNELLKEVFAIYSESSSTIQKNISNLFNDLKDQKSTSVIVDLIKTTNDNKAQIMLLSACWNSRLDFIDYLETFIDLVMLQGFEISFEAFTVIENLESKVTNERKIELVSYVKENLNKCLENNQVLSHDTIGIIENYEEL